MVANSDCCADHLKIAEFGLSIGWFSASISSQVPPTAGGKNLISQLLF
jgi:hypothetical protein